MIKYLFLALLSTLVIFGCTSTQNGGKFDTGEIRTCNSDLNRLHRGMTKDEVKAIYGLPIDSGHTNDGWFYWFVVTKASTTFSAHERYYYQKSWLQLFFDKNNRLAAYRESCDGKNVQASVILK